MGECDDSAVVLATQWERLQREARQRLQAAVADHARSLSGSSAEAGLLALSQGLVSCGVDLGRRLSRCRPDWPGGDVRRGPGGAPELQAPMPPLDIDKLLTFDEVEERNLERILRQFAKMRGSKPASEFASLFAPDD